MDHYPRSLLYSLCINCRTIRLNLQDSPGGVSSWIENTTTKKLAFYAAWTYWVVHIPYLAQKPQGIGANDNFTFCKSTRNFLFFLFS